jgi:uncharacterized membrane protein
MNEFYLDYLSAYYYIFELDIYINANDYNKDLDGYLIKGDFKTWALITAFNPKSVVMSDEENKANNLNLKKDLSSYFFLNSKSGSKNDNWSKEFGFIAFNIPKSIAISLASKYKQNAILYGETKKKSELVFI